MFCDYDHELLGLNLRDSMGCVAQATDFIPLSLCFLILKTG